MFPQRSTAPHPLPHTLGTWPKVHWWWCKGGRNFYGGGGPSGRSLGHCGHVLEEDWRTPGPPLCTLVCFLAIGEQINSTCTPAMMCSLVRGPKQRGQLITDWNLQNCGPKQTFSLHNLIISGVCYNDRNWLHSSWSGGLSYGIDPSTCGIWCYFQVDNVRFESNSSTPVGGHWRIGYSWGKISHFCNQR
jgi:hypothetical protein